MSIDAIAILPEVGEFQEECLVEKDGWMLGEGPGGGRGLWRKIESGTLLNLGFSIQAPDDTLYRSACLWMGTLPTQIWVFPDVVIPDKETAQAIQSATQEVGRWVQADSRVQSILADLGFSSDEEQEWQRKMNSGHPELIQAAVGEIERRLSDRDFKEIEVVLAKLLNQG